MFDLIRKHIKVLMIAFFPLVIFAFVFVGVDTTFLSQRSPVVARVDGHDITQVDWDQAHQQYVSRMLADNPHVPPGMLDSPVLRYSVLESLVRDQLFSVVAHDRHYFVTNTQLADTLHSLPEIAALYQPDGRLDMEAYRRLLAQNGLTTEQYESSVRQQLAMQQVLGVVEDAGIDPPVQAAIASNAVFQRRDASLTYFRPAEFTGKVSVDDASLKHYYDAHQHLFERPEEADLHYIVLDLASLTAGVKVDEAELHAYYENNKASFATTPEQRQVRQILFATEPGMSASQREAVHKRAEAALEQLRKDPSLFAEIARKESDDPGSAEAGGDLGYIERGEMIPAFESAAFSLKLHAISDLVTTDYGYHIIQVENIRPAVIPDFAAVHARLEREARTELGRTEFSEKSEQMLNLAQNDQGDLQGIAKQLGLEVETADGITRTPGPTTPAVLRAPALLQAVFDPHVLRQGNNTNPIDVGENRIVMARVTQFHPTRVLPFDDVRSEVQQRLVAQESAVLARQVGEQTLKDWRAKPADAVGGEQVVLSRQSTHGLGEQAVSELMALPQKDFPAVHGFIQSDGSYVIAKVTGIAPLEDKTVSEQSREIEELAQQQQIRQMLTMAETEAYYNLLKHSYKVQIRVQRPSGFN